jgi:hypothetical protein
VLAGVKLAFDSPRLMIGLSLVHPLALRRFWPCEQ